MTRGRLPGPARQGRNLGGGQGLDQECSEGITQECGPHVFVGSGLDAEGDRGP